MNDIGVAGMDRVAEDLREEVDGLKTVEEKIEFLEGVKDVIAELSPVGHMPVANVHWVKITDVEANDYNPNSVPKNEMRLLYTSIKSDGYTQPVVTVYDEERQKYVVVDGFHRQLTMKTNKDIREWTHGYLPVVVLDTDINNRMASTVRHNRARGKHAIEGMSGMVFSMLENGMTDEEVCAELGLSVDELLRLKHVTGFSKLFENVEYRKQWEMRSQVRIRKDWREYTARCEELGETPLDQTPKGWREKWKSKETEELARVEKARKKAEAERNKAEAELEKAQRKRKREMKKGEKK